jgi:hypothetical protein
MIKLLWFHSLWKFMTMFSIFGSKSEVDDLARAREAFEKVAGLRSDSRDARSARLRMGLLCRAHIDKTFIDGAEQTATWQELASTAIARGQPSPSVPKPVMYQTVSAVSGDVKVYLPEEIVEETFLLGMRYQKGEVTAERAIEAVQAVADKLFRFELRMDTSFHVLQFLRDELGQSSGTEASPATAP